MAMNDRGGIPSDWVAVTTSDTAFVDLVGLRVTAAGTVSAQTTPGTTVAFGSCAVGDTIPGKFVRVMATGTTATVVGAKV